MNKWLNVGFEVTAENKGEVYVSNTGKKYTITGTTKNQISIETDKGHIIDLRGVTCPLNFVKAKIELEKLNIGDVLEVFLDEGEPVQNVPASFAEQGQQVLEIKSIGDCCNVKVQRKK